VTQKPREPSGRLHSQKNREENVCSHTKKRIKRAPGRPRGGQIASRKGTRSRSLSKFTREKRRKNVRVGTPEYTASTYRAGEATKNAVGLGKYGRKKKKNRQTRRTPNYTQASDSRQK